jgi:uncharacterized surface protein with fasciclin (FAS1) repeats
MKKLLFALGLAVAAVPLFTGSASAHSMNDYDRSDSGYNHQDAPDADTCARLADKMARLNSRFDQDSDRRLERQQRVIDRQNEEGCPATGTIVDNLVQNGNFTTLVTAVQAANLGDALSAPGDKTVFAPTDQAFAALPAGTVEALVQDVPTLTTVLTQHVVAGKVDAATAAEAGQATALNGNPLTITEDDGDLFVNGVQVILYDIMTTNGIIHVIDHVLLP